MKEKNLNVEKQRKDNQKQTTKHQLPKGITLATLVITVIILLILAAVAISMITVGDGLFGKANSAGHKYEEAAQNEADTLASLLSSEYLNGGGSGDVSQEDLIKIIQDLTSRVETLENQGGSGGSNILAAYPVGSIYISTSETNPGELFGGTWEAYAQGRTLVGVGTGEDTRGEQLQFTLNQTGGEYNHVLAETEMPGHTHTLTAVTGTSTTQATYFKHYSYSTVVVGASSSTDSSSTSYSVRNVLTSATTSSGTTSSTGGGQAHNNTQPYIACHIWKRVS